jgi:paraquat-inducible protein B
MSKQANKSLIGAFVVGAVVLAIGAVLIFGSGRFFSKSFINVMYFRGSIKGLNVGSPVMFRGVSIGSVKRIELRYDAKDLSFIICVYAEIDPRTMVYVGHEPGTQHTDELIKKGLRARLEAQSMVTGQLVVNLDFFPLKPAHLLGLDKRYPEIPTVASEFDELLNAAEEIPIKELMAKGMHTLDALDKIVSSPRIASSLASLDEGLKEARSTLRNVNDRIGPVLSSIKETSDAFREVAHRGEGLPDTMEKTLATMQDTMKQAEKSLAAASEVASADSDMMQQIQATLGEVSDTSRSVRFLSDYLQRHPEAVIRGRKP